MFARFTILALAVACMAPEEASAQGLPEHVRSACPELASTSGDGTDDPRAFVSIVENRRFEVGWQCLVAAQYLRAPDQNSQRGIEALALLLVKAAHETRLCASPRPVNLDFAAFTVSGMLTASRDWFGLRDIERRTRLALAIERLSNDARVFSYRPSGCPNNVPLAVADRAHRRGVRELLATIVRALPDERSVGLQTTWAAVPQLGIELGMEIDSQPSFPGNDIYRNWILRRGEQTFALEVSGERSWDRMTRVNVYLTPERRIGLIIDGRPQLEIDPGSAQWHWNANADPDTWAYLGAFDSTEERWSDGTHRNIEFVTPDRSPECIARGDEPTSFRANSHADSCARLTRDSIEYLYTQAVFAALLDWQAQGVPFMWRNASPTDGTSGGGEFFLWPIDPRAEPAEAADPPRLALRVVDTQTEPIERAAQRLAPQGIDEYWAIDARRAQIVVFSRPRWGNYRRHRTFDASENVESRLVPGVRLRLDSLALNEG